MASFVNNDVSSGNTILASDHNEQGARIAAVLNGGIDNSNISSSAAIDGSKLSDNSVSTSKLATGAGQPGGAWTTYTPSWSNFTVGNGVFEYARYTQVGKTLTVRTKFNLGTTSSATSTPVRQSVPVTGIGYGSSPFQQIGSGIFYDASANVYYPIGVLMHSTSEISFFAWVTNTNHGVLQYLDTIPAGLANGDFIQVQYEYEAA